MQSPPDTKGRQESIAIIGMGCRLPGSATNLSKFWDLLSRGESAWTKVPDSRFNQDAFYNPDSKTSGTFHSRGGHFLTGDISRYDANFFNVNPAEAQAMDPQLRLLLEVAYEAVENAGLSLDKLRGTSTSSYVALYNRDYEKMLLRDPENLPFYHQTGNGEAMFANRLAYFFDLNGASVTLDTGCSGGMVALHLACESIRNGVSSQSLVGASNLILDPATMIGPSFLRFYAADGRTKAFDQRADGYGRGEGVCCVMLKSLAAALKDGDPIHAVIRSSAINQDGRTPGITVPSGDAQESLIRAAYHAAALSPAKTGYIETHGSGTALGDLTETKAIGSVLGAAQGRLSPVLLGSVKTNIGHLENASGLAAIIKAALVIEKDCIPPTINLQKANADISWKEWNIEIANRWQRLSELGSGSSQVSLNSFGFGGTNVHIVLDRLQDFDRPEQHTNGRNGFQKPNPNIYILSARSSESARLMAVQFQEYLQQNSCNGQDHDFLEDLAHTLYTRRPLFPWRAAIVADSASALEQHRPETWSFYHAGKRSPKLSFIFTGQGAQWETMGRDLLETNSAFRESIWRADQYLSELGVEWKLIDELMKPLPESRLGSAVIAQAASTAVQLALVDMLASWNVYPTAVTGHSSGEIAAAYAGKIVSFRDAMLIAYARGCAVGQLARQNNNPIKGAMIAVGLDVLTAKQYFGRLSDSAGLLTVACVNSPQSVTVSGDEAAIIQLEKILEQESIFVRRLPVDVAYHSHHMLRVAEDYRSALSSLQKPCSNPDVVFHSSVKAKVLDGAELDAHYWVKNLVSPVLFSAAVESLTQAPKDSQSAAVSFLVEIGPHAALKGPIKQILGTRMGEQVRYAPTIVRHKSSRHTMLDLAADLFKHGYDIDINLVNFGNAEAARPRRCLSDLPPYPFDHSTSFWHGSRLSRNYRHRVDPPHELLGVLSVESSALEPRWRNYIGVSTAPWLSGHKINDEVIFPAAGFLSMAFEAGIWYHTHARGQYEQNVCSIQLSNVSIARSLSIPESGPPIEIMFVLRPGTEQAGRDLARRHEFVIYSYPDGAEVVEHCRGFMSVVPTETISDHEFHPNKRMNEIRVDHLYHQLKHHGIDYTGPFQRLAAVTAQGGYCSATIDDPEDVGEGYRSSMHPATIDTCLQTIFPAIRSLRGIQRAAMPTHIQEASLCVPGQTLAHRSLNISSQVQEASGDRFKADIEAHLEGLGCILSVKQMEATPVRGIPSKREHDFDQVKTCQKTALTIDPDFFTAHDIQFLCNANLTNASVTHRLSKLAHACRYYAKAATESIDNNDIHRMTSSQRQYFAWIQNQAALYTEVEECASRKILDDVKASGSEGEIVCRIGQNLASILKGDDDPLSLMLNEDLLSRLYRDDESMQRCAIQAAEYATVLGRKSPSLRILEIGAGTGGTTLPILQALSVPGGSLFEHYCFTDVSSGFFPNAKDKFASWIDRMSFDKLNIEDHPRNQGFEPGSYDLVIAANVLHATTYIDSTAKHVRSLLKPGGKLLLLESTRPTVHRSFFLGTLPGWWLGSMERNKDNPLLTVNEWHDVLQRTDFSGVDAAMHSYEIPEEQTDSLIVSSASSTSTKQASDDRPVQLVLSKEQLWGQAGNQAIGFYVAEDLMALFGSDRENIVFLGNADFDGRVCVFLGELDGPSILANLDNDSFAALKSMCKRAREIIWVTCGATERCENPRSALVLGLARVLRRENAHVQLTTLDLDPSSRFCANRLATSVFDFLQRRQPGSATRDHEWTQRDGKWLVPRIVTDDGPTQYVRSQTIRVDQLEHRLENFYQAKRPLCLAIGDVGTLQDLHFTDNIMLTQQPLGLDEVEIEVRASGVNFRDIMVSLGQMPDELVAECSGIVLAVGSQLQNDFSQGDRVYTWHVPRYASRVRAKGSLTRCIPPGFSFEDAASIPVVYSTAYHALVNIARLNAGETVLIHSGAGGVGQAAVTLALNIGAKVFTTVGSEQKKQLLVEKYGLSPSHIFSSRSNGFVKGIGDMTSGFGVDVVLNALAGSFLQDSINLLAPFGRFVEIGKNDILANSRMDLGIFSRSTTFTALDLVQLVREKPDIAADVFSRVDHLFRTGVARPPSPQTIFDISKIEDAFRIMQKGEHVGKLVVSHSPAAQVKVTPPHPRPAKLRPDASYLIIGGQGGLGRALCTFLVHCGARSLVILSPSGSQKPATRALVEEMAEIGVCLHALQCDVDDRRQVAAALAKCNIELPPIRGILHAGLVLKDSSFDNMSVEDFCHALRPKLAGTYNIHEAFQQQQTTLDFFVLLSSYVGLLGSPGRANYAAASTFQDAFARWRTSQGLPTRSLDLGTVQGAGSLHEKPEAMAHFERMGLGGIPLEAFYALIGYAISTPLNSIDESQTAIGWAPPSSWTGSVYKALDPRYSHLRPRINDSLGESSEDSSSTSPPTTGAKNLPQALASCRSQDELVSVTSEAISKQIVSILGVVSEDIDFGNNIAAHGGDSLVAIEFRNWFRKELRCSFTTDQILTGCSVQDLVLKAVREFQV
ncbi:hypothetical protein MW887_008788 [Aspergillus wentii]|nr:hypothetical protein MW887_008788 [Aspergillus wentii]